MSKTAKNISLAAVLSLAATWIVAYIWQFLPSPMLGVWYFFPAILTSEAVVIAAFFAGLFFPFKEKP